MYRKLLPKPDGEGWARHLKAGQIEAYSAGIERHGMNPNAILVMEEAGIDIRERRSKNVEELLENSFDDVVTVCGHAHETCLVFPGRARVVHVGIGDPPKLAKDARTEEEALSHYRRVRNEIRDFIQTLPGPLVDDSGGSH